MREMRVSEVRGCLPKVRDLEGNNLATIGYTRVIWFPWWPDSKESACKAEDLDLIPPWIQKNSLEKGMATHSSTLAWKIPRTEEPGGLQSTVPSHSKAEMTSLAQVTK